MAAPSLLTTVLLSVTMGFRSVMAVGRPVPPHIAEAALTTTKPVSEAKLNEMKQDFVDVDFNDDAVMDAQEIRAHFQRTISNLNFYQFFLDCDTDNSGSVSLQEYANYASMIDNS